MSCDCQTRTDARRLLPSYHHVASHFDPRRLPSGRLLPQRLSRHHARQQRCSPRQRRDNARLNKTLRAADREQYGLGMVNTGACLQTVLRHLTDAQAALDVFAPADSAARHEDKTATTTSETRCTLERDAARRRHSWAAVGAGAWVRVSVLQLTDTLVSGLSCQLFRRIHLVRSQHDMSPCPDPTHRLADPVETRQTRRRDSEG